MKDVSYAIKLICQADERYLCVKVDVILITAYIAYIGIIVIFFSVISLRDTRVSGHHFLSESSFWSMHFLMNFLTNVALLKKKKFFFFKRISQRENKGNIQQMYPFN